ncbi:hypothetical protein IQ264_19640 [Phormidium sp. LEGE 05292]|uniref:hypothetical protein n=1 Tax=[Phormidium] sp. LEGE 05292 TaxID=767427 RepID=UPI00187FD606|nr:hypothetical protein [Phormidium sp. LEGE 05292]MBE9227644.1 hypothetical protein [Phormidium sp. LEGE 05292]
MTALFDRIKPAERFRISKREIAKFLGIAESLIKKVKNWPYVIFVHRLDKGGQFISYRKIEKWRNAVACQIQKCTNLEELQQLANGIRRDWKKHYQQYEDVVLRFLERIWDQRLEVILQGLTKEFSIVNLPIRAKELIICLT